jgi:AraC family transcriptional regulator, regulatory protein of adaptative response / DNA-3-methyladenine glycosylase II
MPSCVTAAVAIERASKASRAGSERLRLTAATPFDWASIAAFLAARTIPGVEAVDADGVTYRRSIRVDGSPGLTEIRPAAGSGVEVRVDAPAAAVSTIEARLRRWFDLDADVAAIGLHLGRDPLLAPLVAARPGLRVPGAWDPFELAVRAIVGQQISVAGARTIAGRIVERCGERLPSPGGDVMRLFPTPDQLAGADLDAIGMPGARVRAIQNLAAAVAADPRLLDRTDDLAADVARLRALPGVGEWTAQYIALRGLKHPDAFPASDLGILRALAGPEGRRPTPAQALVRAEAWRPYRAYAAQHLWSADA